MKITVTFSCGHTGEIEVFGKNDEREKTIWKAEHFWICPNCREKEKEEKNQQAAARNQQAGLPPLTGSPKQIAWAETIRAEIMSRLEALPAADGAAKELKKQVIAFYRTKDKAGEWIDLRNTTDREIVKAAFDAIANTN